jgi:serpin B
LSQFAGHADDKIHAYFSAVVDSLSTPVDGYQLHSANRLYVQDNYHVLPAYTKALADHYKSAPHSVDFEKNATAVASDINRWVEQVTHDRIKNLIGPGVLNALTRLVLVNAVYFKGDWCDKFYKRDTRPMPFYSSAIQQKEVGLISMR